MWIFSKKIDMVASMSRGLRAVIDIIWTSSSLEIAKTVPVKLSLLHQMAKANSCFIYMQKKRVILPIMFTAT